ncbi:hypothetical protein M378DRAFT_83437 [Amanita muscaria Koide BX008]|uniref:choline-phosphate cytidylyltransferase n=1 Tax=Amanita muscaria (strain Koide BX008) TaxID=946122 RepID=A0A0C2SCN9_AMAMK|nr:hypothetical protein M378DRAFT_83437 [Amanita muscaria Koide BX008]
MSNKRVLSKHPRNFDSPARAYDASEEDNDPLTDDGSAVSMPFARLEGAKGGRGGKAPRLKQHQLIANLLSDSDGIDSPTYDGDIESSATLGVDGHISKVHPHPRPLSISTLSPASTPAESSLSPVVTPSGEVPDPITSARAVDPESQHPVFISQPIRSEQSPTTHTLNPALFTIEDIQAFVKKAIAGESTRPYTVKPPPSGRPVRIYADGVYDLFHFGHALQLRQAKSSFPSVHLLVGVNSDEQVREHKSRTVMNHQERLEAVRHCRWVDEVVPDAPWIIDNKFLEKYQIDYVAHDEDPYISAGQADVYGHLKEQGKFLPTRRTPGISTSDLLERIVSGYRNRDFDAKLANMGHSELCAEGSDFDDYSRKAES